MKSLRWLCAIALTLTLAVPAARAQEFPKPGPEHEMLKKLEGTWDANMKGMGMDSKGTMTYKMELSGLWLTSNYEGDFGGTKFLGKGLDTYDKGKKKFIGVWIDNMMTVPFVMEGTYDSDKKALTMTGDAPGPDGKLAKMRAVTHFVDDNTVNFEMFMGDGKEPAFTIAYKRKK